jgi:hypothetical protein
LRSTRIYRLGIYSLALAIILNPAANSFAAVLPYMPPTDEILTTSKAYDLPSLKGLRFFSDSPFEFTFLLEQSTTPLDETALRQNIENIGKYFLAALTIPEKDLWVNLSPYEKERISPKILALTDLGKDMLGEDYILKQLTSSLTYPQSQSGREFWKKVYEQAKERFGSKNIPINTFNKVWIVPNKIRIIETKDTVILKESTLKVLTEEDYLAMQKNNIVGSRPASTFTQGRAGPAPTANSITAMRDVIIPLLEKEVNTGKHFAYLRQIYNSIIIATWFKEKLADSILAKVYFDKKMVKGAECNDPDVREKIYNEYTKAFREGVYKYTEKNITPGYTNKIITRQYVSGGLGLTHISKTIREGKRTAPSLEVLSAILTQRLSPEGMTLIPLDAAGRDLSPQQTSNAPSITQIRETYEKEKGSLSKIGAFATTLVLRMENAIQQSVAAKFCKKGNDSERAQRELVVFRARRAMANIATKRNSHETKQLTMAHLERIWAVHELAPNNEISDFNIYSGWYAKSTCTSEAAKDQSLGLQLSQMFDQEEAQELIRCGAVAANTIEPDPESTMAEVEMPIPLSPEITLIRQTLDPWLRAILIEDKYVKIITVGGSRVYAVQDPQNTQKNRPPIVFTSDLGVDYEDQAFLYAYTQIDPVQRHVMLGEAAMQKRILLKTREAKLTASNKAIDPDSLKRRLRREFGFRPLDAAIKEQLRRENRVNDNAENQVLVYTPKDYKGPTTNGTLVFTDENSGPNFRELAFIAAQKLWHAQPAPSSRATMTTEDAIRQGMLKKGIDPQDIFLLGPHIREYARRIVDFDIKHKEQPTDQQINTAGIHPEVINALSVKTTMEYFHEAIDTEVEIRFVNSLPNKDLQHKRAQMCYRARRAMANIAMQTGRLIRLDAKDLEDIWQAHLIDNPAGKPKGLVFEYDHETGHFKKTTYTISTLGKKSIRLKANPKFLSPKNEIVREILKCAAAGNSDEALDVTPSQKYEPKSGNFIAIADAADYIMDKLLIDIDSDEALAQYEIATNDRSERSRSYQEIIQTTRIQSQSTLEKAIQNDQKFIFKALRALSTAQQRTMVKQISAKLTEAGLEPETKIIEEAFSTIFFTMKASDRRLEVDVAKTIARQIHANTGYTAKKVVAIIQAIDTALAQYLARVALKQDLSSYILLNINIQRMLSAAEKENRVKNTNHLPIAPVELRDHIERYLRDNNIKLREQDMENLSRLVYAARQRAGDRGAVEAIDLNGSNIDLGLLKDIDLYELTTFGMGIVLEKVIDKMIFDLSLTPEVRKAIIDEGYLQETVIDNQPVFIVGEFRTNKSNTLRAHLYSKEASGADYEALAWMAAYDSFMAKKGNQKNTGGFDFSASKQAIKTQKNDKGIVFSNDKTADYLLNGKLAGFRLEISTK